MKKIFALLILVVLFALQACNTIKGVGRDIERTGEAIDERI